MAVRLDRRKPAVLLTN